MHGQKNIKLWLICIQHGGTMTVESIIIAHNCKISYLPTFFKEFIQILLNTQWKVLALQWVNTERKYTWSVSYMILSEWFTWGDLNFFIEICMNALFELAWACRSSLYSVSVFSVQFIHKGKTSQNTCVQCSSGPSYYCCKKYISKNSYFCMIKNPWVEIFFLYIQGVTGGMDQTSGGCSLC